MRATAAYWLESLELPTVARNFNWRIAIPETARVRLWGEEVVVFHSGSGDTHLFSGAVANLIRRSLQESGMLAAPWPGRTFARDEELHAAVMQLRSIGLAELTDR